MVKEQKDAPCDSGADASPTTTPKISPAGRASMRGFAESDVPLDDRDPAHMTIKSAKLTPETQSALEAQGLNSSAIAEDATGKRAEAAVRTVVEREGLPDGSAHMEHVKGVVPGTYDGVHGIDLIAVKEDGTPMPIEVKNRSEVSQAALSETDTARLEPEIEKARAAYQEQLRIARAQLDAAGVSRDAKPEDLRIAMEKLEQLRQSQPSSAEAWKPEVAAQQQQIDADALKLQDDGNGNLTLPVEQMDRLWTQDRYLKLLRASGGPERLMTAGVDPKYCKLENFVDGNGALLETPLWDGIMANRTTVVVSSQEGDTAAGHRMTRQALFEDRSGGVVLLSTQE